MKDLEADKAVNEYWKQSSLTAVLNQGKYELAFDFPTFASKLKSMKTVFRITMMFTDKAFYE